MNNVISIDNIKSHKEEEDFNAFSILHQLQTGEEVEQEIFTTFMIQAKEVIRSLQGMLRM